MNRHRTEPIGDSVGDAALVRRTLDGDPDAFGRLLRLHDPAMRRVAYRLLGRGDAMDDALQEAYLKAYRALRTYRVDAKFSSWLYRIVYNACLDELRRAQRRPVSDFGGHDPESPTPGPERTATAAAVVRDALDALPIDQRAAVVLVDGEGLDHRTVANLLDVPPGTVASRLSRGRAVLRRMIGDADDD
jgi:RNA polymerase sigma-70 factor (ECF subfamily)